MSTVSEATTTRPITGKVRVRGSWHDDVAAIVAMLPDAIFRCERDDAGRVVWILNEGKLAEELGVPTDRIRGRATADVLSGEVARAMDEGLRAAFDGDARPFVVEADGRALHVSPQPAFDSGGVCYAVIGFISDVTALRHAESQVRELNRTLRSRVHELAVANRQLEAFSAAVSHDLRNPLNLISLSAQQLARGAAVTDPSTQEALGRLQHGVRRMSQLIDDIMRLARATRGQIRRERVDVSQLARAVADERLLAESGRRIEVTIADGMVAHGDTALVRIVLDNLLGNAIKYTQDAAVAVVKVGEATRDGRRTFFVSDNGIGFPMDDVERIFRPFERGDDALQFDGTGVGLATVVRVVHAHEGRVWAESAPGEGATFFFTLGKEDV